MEWLIILCGGIGLAYLGMLIGESDVRVRLLGIIPIPNLLIAGVLILAGVVSAISGLKMMPDHFLRDSLGQIFDFGSDKEEADQQVSSQHDIAEDTFSYVYGSWGEKFVRSNGYTYPYVFYLPLEQCRGFTLDYEVSDITEGNLNGNFRFEIYVRTTAGKWKSVELFSMEDYKTTVEVRFDNPMDIDAVAVVCQKKSNVTFSYNLWVRDPV